MILIEQPAHEIIVENSSRNCLFNTVQSNVKQDKYLHITGLESSMFFRNFTDYIQENMFSSRALFS